MIMDFSQDLRRTHRVAVIVAAGILVELVLLLVAEEILRARLAPFRGFASLGDIQVVRYAAYGLSILQVLLIRGLRARILAKPAGTPPEIRLQRLRQASIVTTVLAEIPALLGFMLFALAGLFFDFYVLLFVSLVLVFMHFPRRASWDEWLRE